MHRAATRGKVAGEGSSQGWEPSFAHLPHSHSHKGLRLPRAKVKFTAEVLEAIIRESRVGHRNVGRMNGFGW